jgi:thiamine biosynthesis protein ThiI
MKFIVKLFPEIIIKSKSVRVRFIKQLRQNLHTIAKKRAIKIRIDGGWDSLVVYSDDKENDHRDEIITLLSDTPGVGQFIEVSEHTFDDVHHIFELTKDVYAESLAGKTFCVRCKRGGKHDFTSIDVERYVGGGLNQHTDAAGVSLKNPDMQINLEIKNDSLYLVRKQYKGLGGFPLGSQGSVLSLISGGFDSNVASYMMTKRGLKTHYCFFNLGGANHEIGVKQVAHYLWEKFGNSHKVKFITIPFEGVVAELLENVDNAYMGVVLKRMMLRASSKVADHFKIEALVTGEAIAQVSSQTLTNLAVIDSVTDSLVLRPLITMDKQDIIDLSVKIGTYDYAKSMPEYCGVISDKPTTSATAEKVAEVEAKFDFAVLDQAFEDLRVCTIDKVLEARKTAVDVELVNIPSITDIIIDIRASDEEENNPLIITSNEVIKIPFYKLNTYFANVDPSQQYLLYCQKGTMSQLHAQHLNQQGFNVKVYTQ